MRPLIKATPSMENCVQALIGLFRTMRPKQWTKNVLFVFPAIIFDRQLTNTDSLLRVIIACILLILMSGTVYIINDLVDIEKDRQHPKKKTRPLPSGQLPQSLAKIAAIVIPTVSLIAAFLFEPALCMVLVIYLAIQVAYSFWLKNIVIVDVLTVTSGFLLRVLAGVVVINNPPVANFSPWLYACSGLLALFLAVGKRRQELITLGEHALQTRPIFKDYNLALIDDMLRLVTTSTFIAYLLYTIEADIASFRGIKLALLTVPFVLYGLYRYLYLIHVRGEGSAPDEVLLRDRPLQLALIGWGLAFVSLLYLVPSGS
jgi:4-hydroxybenzoate polyprenyltransferase